MEEQGGLGDDVFVLSYLPEEGTAWAANTGLDGGLGADMIFMSGDSPSVDVTLELEGVMTQPYKAAVHGFEAFKGTTGVNNITGTPGNDRIESYGSGHLYGLAGDDDLRADGAADLIDGGDGVDSCNGALIYLNCE